MEKNALKSFDISSFDIEVKYNQEIAPINESIEALHNELQRKSLHSHKDFLAREKLTIENIEKIRLEQEEQKQILASEKQAELDELQEKKLHIKHELETFIEKTNNENENLFADINNELEALKQSEQDDIQEIENRYNVNVTTQVEIRDFFKSNYDKNMETQQQIIEQYNLLFTEKMVEIDQIKQQTDQMIEEKLAQFSEAKILENKQTTLLFEEVEREFNKDTTNIRKDSNLRAKEIKEMIDGMKKVIHDRYLDYMSILSERRTQIKIDIDERTKLIDKDLEINLEKLNKELSSELDSLSNRTQKSIKMKFDLFNLRAETTKKYEIAFMEEEMLLIADETKYIQKILDDELQNLDKLEIFLLSDQNEIKELGDYFKSINLSLKKELNSFEISNNNYLVKHEVIKAEFIKKYNSLFQQFKKQLVEFNQTKLSQMTKLNQEIDDINLYLDFSDSQKEIQVNDLRKSIEINETKEKYNMLFAKQNHRLSLLNHELSTKIAIEKARINDLCSEIQLQIDVILLKLDLDQQIIEVDANNKELSELHSQKIDNSKLERIILDEKYAKELLVHDYQQQIFELEAKRDNELLLTELEAEIKFAESQTSSKITAIQNQLEQETIQMKETIRAFEFEKESISKNIDTKNTLRLIEFDKQTNHVNVEFDNKVKLIQEALIRETKDAKNSLTQLEHFINERVYKLDFASLTLSDFIQNTDSTLQDEHLSLEDLASTVGKADDMVLQATDFISQSYNVFNQAVDFMFDLERRTLEKKINACSDDSESKKLAKSFQSLLKEQDKKLQYILNTRKENENSIIFEIKNNFEAINKQKSSDKVTYVSELNKIYHDAFETLESFRNNITSEIQIVYSPITQANRDIIDYANEHAAKTISAHDSTRQQDLNQINEELEVFIKEQEALKVQSIQDIDEKIKPLHDSIIELNEKANNDISVISSECEAIISVKKSTLEEIRQNQSTLIAAQQEQLLQMKHDFDLSYQSALEQLSQKNTNSENKFEADSKMNQMAIELYKARYNDFVSKANGKHTKNIESNAYSVKKLKASTLKFINDSEKELRELIHTFEKNILEMKPRLEKEILAVQQNLDKTIFEKETKLNSLLKEREKTAKYLQENLSSQFRNGYEILLQELQTYLSHYQKLASEYTTSFEQSTNDIEINNKALTNALFELGKKKHTDTLKKLLEINKRIS